ncbi:hypothetical protein ACSSV6_000882 [Roseovarius sp. MBR-38]|jgi:hypothetical protein
MHLAGKTLLSKATILTARSLMALSTAITIVLWFDMDVTGFTILGIDPGQKLDEGTISVLVFLSISLVVNWVSDVTSNGMFSLFSGVKPISEMCDITIERSYIAQIKERVGVLEGLVAKFQVDNSDAELMRIVKLINSNVNEILTGMDELDKSGWWFSLYARFYVVGWYLAVPLGMAAFATFLLYHA